MGSRMCFGFAMLFSVMAFSQTFSSIENTIDVRTLNELVQTGQQMMSSGQSCRSQNYVNSVKLFYLSAIQSNDFVREANKPFRYGNIDRDTKKVFTLNKCFVEASLFAVMPDVQAGVSQVIKSPVGARRVEAALLANWDILKYPEDKALLRTSNLAASMFTVLSLSEISSCDFESDPLMFVSASYKLQLLFTSVYSVRTILTLMPIDACYLKVLNENLNNFHPLMMQKAQQYWGP